MKTIQRKFTHPSDGLEMTYNVDVYAPKGKLLISTVRGDLGFKQAKGKNRRYAIELHNSITWKKMIEDGVTTIAPYVNRFPDHSWLPKERLHVKSSRLRENFISARYMEQDDDSGTDDTLDFWLQDEFFSMYGYAFILSSSSTPEQEKGHPFIVFNIEITDRDLYEDCLNAWVYYYKSRSDKAVTSSNELYYHKKGSKVVVVGNICPFETYRKTFLVPYYDHIKQLETQRKRQREKRRRNRSTINKNYDGYIYVAHKNLIEELSGVSGGSGLRHTVLLKVGRTLAGLAVSDWHNFDTSEWQDDIINAATTNGYVSTYGRDSVERTLSLWDSVDGVDEPN